MSKEIEITVDGKVRSRIFPGRTLAEAAPHLEGYPEIFIVHDVNAAQYAESLASLAGDRVRGLLPVEATEEEKTFGTVLRIDRWLMDRSADRQALLLAVGGGITTDMAGFAACIYKRGIRFAFVPTTLLSQVDAAIGGKTGVNFDAYKNMLGVIRQPEFTYICPEVLETLPQRDFLSGAAELLKTFLIEDRKGCYETSAALLKSLREGASRKEYAAEIQTLVMEAAAIKAGIVSRDPYEAGERRFLNLGHTFAHAIEHEGNSGTGPVPAPTHGEAVAMGILLAARLSESLGKARPGLVSRLRKDFTEAGLPARCPFSLESLAEAMERDKKAEDGRIHFVILREPGAVETVSLTVAEAIQLLEYK